MDRKILTCCYISPRVHRLIHIKNEIGTTINIGSNGEVSTLKNKQFCTCFSTLFNSDIGKNLPRNSSQALK